MSTLNVTPAFWEKKKDSKHFFHFIVMCVDRRIFITARFHVCYFDLLGQCGEDVIVLLDTAEKSLDKVNMKVGWLKKN